MTIRELSLCMFAFTGVVALVCTAMMLFADNLGWSPAPFNVIQILATALCFPSSICFIWSARRDRGYIWGLAVVACSLSGLFLATLGHFIVTFDLSDF